MASVRDDLEKAERRTRLKAVKFLVQSGLIVLTATHFPSINPWRVLDILPVDEEAPVDSPRLSWEIQ